MNFDDYQQKAKLTNTMTDSDLAPMYFTLGLTGEAGEIAEKVKKIIRNQGGDFSQLDREDITKELGDVLWYLAMLADNFGVSLSDVAEKNLAKLADRQARGVIKSTGDNR